MANIKTLEQIKQEFIEEYNLIKMETPPDDNIYSCININQQASELSKFFKSMYLNGSDTKSKKTRNGIKRTTDIILLCLLCAAIILIFTSAIIFNGNSNKRSNLFGYSGFTVLTKSMQSEISEGSLVLVKKADPININVGDDITFTQKDNSIVTHRVISIVENYKDGEDRGFQTQGIENSEPDPDFVYADNIIGVVKLTIPNLGAMLNYISENSIIIVLIAGGLFIIIIAVKKLVYA